MDDLIYASATALAQAIRKKQVSSLEVVDAYLARIEAVNPMLNAVVQVRAEKARDEARAADSALAPVAFPAPLPGLVSSAGAGRPLVHTPLAARLNAGDVVRYALNLLAVFVNADVDREAATLARLELGHAAELALDTAGVGKAGARLEAGDVSILL